MGSENIDVRRAEVNFEVEDTPAYLLRNVLRGDTSISIAYHYHRHDIHRRLHGVELLPSTVLVGGWYEHGFGSYARANDGWRCAAAACCGE